MTKGRQRFVSKNSGHRQRSTVYMDSIPLISIDDLVVIVQKFSSIIQQNISLKNLKYLGMLKVSDFCIFTEHYISYTWILLEEIYEFCIV